MKITGGKFKGRSLFAPRRIIRPTQDAVREAIFNIIGDSFLQNATVLDLCCGSGALGIEALSRGAKEAIFVDSKKICLLFVRKNLAIFGDGINKKFSLIKADAFKIMKDFSLRGQKFDLILIDPPYYKNLGKKYLNALDEYDILTPNGLAIIEYFKKESLAIGTENLILTTTKQYGDTKVSFFKNC